MPLDLKKDDMGDVIKDFYKSKAPQFKGKSKKKRREMAIAAKLSAERGPLPEYYGMPGGMGSSASKRLRADYDDPEYQKIKDKKDRLLAAVRRGRKKKVNETAYYKSDSKYQKKVADAEKRNKEKDKRMKFGKFYDKAKAAKDRLRPGEVRRYDKTLGRYVSNKE